MKNNIKIMCTKCHKTKTKENFYKDKNRSNGLKCICKKCSDDYNYKCRQKHPLRYKEYAKKYKKKKYLEDPEAVKQRVYDWREKKFGHIKREKQMKRDHKELMKVERKKLRDYKKQHITPFTKYLRTMLWHAFKINRFSYTNSIQIYLGCSFEDLKKHLESQFTKGMTWENKGEWQTDHIVTFSSVNTLEEVKKLCHYTNMQPLWVKDHREKNKIDHKKSTYN